MVLFLLPFSTSLAFSRIRPTSSTRLHCGWNSRQEEDDLAFQPYLPSRTDFSDGERPLSSWELALSNFGRQGGTLISQVLTRRSNVQPPECLGLTLSNEAVAEAEERRGEN